MLKRLRLSLLAWLLASHPAFATNTFLLYQQPATGFGLRLTNEPNNAGNGVNNNIICDAFRSATLCVTVTAAGALKVDGAAVTQPVSATSLPLPAGAATLANQPTNSAQGAATSGQIGTLMFGASTTSPPTDITADSWPLSLTPAGNLRVDGSTITQPVSGTVTSNQGTVAGSGPWIFTPWIGLLCLLLFFLSSVPSFAATKTFYVLATNAVSPNWFGNLQDGGSAPSASTSAYGYRPNVGTASPFNKSFLGATSGGTAKQATTCIGVTSRPTAGTGNTNSTAGDSFVSPSAYTGSFANTAWTFDWNLRATTAGAVGHLNMRVWASVNASGASARELTSGSLAGATVTLSTSADVDSSISWSPGTITLSNEFLFFQLEFQQTAAGVSACNVLFEQGTAIITTPAFTTGGAPSNAPLTMTGVGN